MLVSVVMRQLLLLLLIAGTSASCHRDSSRPPVSAGPAQRPQTEAECKKCNGDWGIHGLSEINSCLCRTRDAGKECKDGLECEGECVVVDHRTEITDPGPPALGYFLGRCSERDLQFGCRIRLGDGTKAKGPVRLDEPLTELCMD